MNIGLTGGIACGKSTVANMLVERGALLVDADRIAREVVEPGSPALAEIAEAFGHHLIGPDGSLNRKELGNLIFGDISARKKLESITHPRIRSLMRERVAAYEQQFPDKLVVVDVPLLYESNLQGMYEKVMVVYVPRELQLRRLMDRDGISLEAAEERLKAQWPIDKKKELADYLIDNSGSREETERQVSEFCNSKGF